MSRYKLQNRYQDSRWEDLGINIASRSGAVATAEHMALDAIRTGMVRVLDTLDHDKVIHTVPAGGSLGNQHS